MRKLLERAESIVIWAYSEGGIDSDYKMAQRPRGVVMDAERKREVDAFLSDYERLMGKNG